MLSTASLGFPRIGNNRELKKALENYWKGSSSLQELENIANKIKAQNWQLQKNANIKYIPSNDFSFYDHILDNIILFGTIPSRFSNYNTSNDLDLAFAMARGIQKDNLDIVAMEMTKWFDTNYHYIVPEFSANQEFNLNDKKIVNDFLFAKSLNIETRPVIIGPISFLLLGKKTEEFEIFSLLPKILITYQALFAKLQEIGVTDIQIDEPFLATDLNQDSINSYLIAYPQIKKFAANIKLHLVSYFAGLEDNISLAFNLATDSVHLDLVRGSQQFEEVMSIIKPYQSISLGLVDGRNIWINNLDNSIAIAKKFIEKIGKDRVIISSSCSLIHSPVDLANEKSLNSEIKSWLAFATQKLQEIANIAIISDSDNKSSLENTYQYLEINRQAILNRQKSPLIHNADVKSRLANISEDAMARHSDFAVRRKIQNNYIKIPLLPTTTIGSFPQTKEVRKTRSDYKSGKIDIQQYHNFVKKEIENAVKWQEEIDLDVLVHGEFERNDMVEYFGEQLAGFCFTENGWVQSYGSRCVKPPIIFGDVYRPKEMTVSWAKYAQSLTNKIMKGMLTGPITILQWSFVRNDQPRKETAMQIAFAIRDEVCDLENAGIKIIQIDEAALREGLPIRKSEHQQYLKWAVEAFKVSSCGVKDHTQIHTHMCYSEFNDIIEAIAKMDADVISIETSRSRMELLNAFIDFKYPNEIGPGVYDIHSPRVPSAEEMTNLLEKALSVLSPEQIWVNPDCGLKTRDWQETKSALINMVNTAKQVRNSLLN